MRQARIFDGAHEDGHHQVSRAPVPAEETERVLAYLEKAPIVLAARGFDTDAVDPSRGAAVPMTFHTDGAWIWPGAVAYYLRTHGLAPEPDLLAHLRARGYQLPEVDDHTRELAVSIITGTPGPERRATRPSPAEDEQRALAAQAERAREQAALTRLRRRLTELGVEPSVYRVDGVADDTWCLVREDGGWSVFWSERGGRHNAVRLATADQAAAYLLGTLLIVPSRMRRPDQTAGPTAPTAGGDGSGGSPGPDAVARVPQWHVLSDQGITNLVTGLRSLDWSWRPDEVERLVTDFGWTIMGRALENFVLTTEFGLGTGDVDVNRSGQVDRISVAASSLVSPRTAEGRAFTQDAFARVVAVATQALGEPTQRIPGESPEVRWRGAESVVAVKRLTVQVKVYLATTQRVDDFDWATSRGL